MLSTALSGMRTKPPSAASGATCRTSSSTTSSPRRAVSSASSATWTTPALRELGERLADLGQVRVELGRLREVGVAEVALQLPLSQPEEELSARPLVDRVLGRTRVELGGERGQLGIVAAGHERGAEPPVDFDVEVLGRQLRQEPD